MRFCLISERDKYTTRLVKRVSKVEVCQMLVGQDSQGEASLVVAPTSSPLRTESRLCFSVALEDPEALEVLVVIHLRCVDSFVFLIRSRFSVSSLAVLRQWAWILAWTRMMLQALIHLYQREVDINEQNPYGVLRVHGLTFQILREFTCTLPELYNGCVKRLKVTKTVQVWLFS